MNRDQNSSKMSGMQSQNSRMSGNGYQSYKVQAEQFNNYISNEEVKIGPTKKRNVVQASSHSHNVGNSSSA